MRAAVIADTQQAPPLGPQPQAAHGQLPCMAHVGAHYVLSQVPGTTGHRHYFSR